MSDDITPFRIDIPEDDVDDLRERLRRTRWPERETVGGHFAAFGQPATFVDEVRAAFRAFR